MSGSLKHGNIQSIYLIVILFLSFFSGNNSLAQNPVNESFQADTINETPHIFDEKSKIVRFQKKVVEHGPDSLMYNTIIVENLTDKKLEGQLTINMPYGWTCVGSELENGVGVSLNPGEKKRYSVWMVQSKNVIGGRTYVITGKLLFDGDRKAEINSAYVKIPVKSDWNMTTPHNKYYFEGTSKNKNFNIKFQNLGNTKELITVEITSGSNIIVRDFNAPKDEFIVELGPGKDTVFQFSASSVEEQDEMITKNIFFNSVGIKASTKDIVKGESLRFIRLPSLGVNKTKSYLQSPLNLEFFNQSGLGTRNSRLIANGDIYFGKYKRLRYLTNISYFRGNDLESTFWRYSNYLVNYRTKHLRIDLGDIGVFSNDIASNSIRGLGLTGFLPNGDVISGRATTSVFFNQQIHLGVSYKKKLRKQIITLMASQQYDGFNLINMSNAGIKLSLLIAKSRVGIRYNVSRRDHYFGPNDFVNVDDENRVLDGQYLEFTNDFRLGKLTSSSLISYASPFYTSNQSNTSQARNTMSYRLNRKNKLINTISFINTNPYQIFRGTRFYTNSFRNIIESLGYVRTINSKLSANLQFNVSDREINFPALGNNIRNEILNYSFGVGATYRIDNVQTISGNYTRGFFVPQSVFNSGGSINLGNPIPTTRISGEYRNRNSGISFSYTNGLFNQSVISTNSDGTFSNRFFILRPYFSKNYFNNRLNVEGNLNAAVFNRFESENYSLNLMSRLEMNKGWSIRANAGVFINRRTFGESETSTSRNFNINFSIKKSFDFQQPAVKYYDLTIKFFTDDNGNGIKDENEMELEDIVAFITYQKNSVKDDASSFSEKELKSDKSGTVIYKYIPSGKYNVTVSPLNKYKGIITSDDLSRDFEVVGNTTLYFGFKETYKIRGKIIMNRDPNSSLGEISLRDIPVFAIDTVGNSYKTLTDENGNFFVSVNAPGLYKVRIQNAFGSSFSFQQDEFEIDFNGIKTYQIEFLVFENKRDLNINGNSGYKFKFLDQNSKGKKEAEPKMQPVQKQAIKNTTIKPSISKEAEEKLWDKADDLQKQIDELRKLKEEIQSLKSDQEKTVQELKLAKSKLDSTQNEVNKTQEAKPETQQDKTPADNFKDYEDLDELINQLIEKTNPRVNYRVEFGVFTEKMPISFLNQLIKFGNIETSQNDDGSSTFKSKPFYTLEEAENYKKELSEKGFENIVVFGEVNGKPVPIDQVKQSQNK